MSHGIALEKLPDLIKNHDCNRFRKFSGKKGSDCRNGHQQGFIKGATIFNPQNTFPYHIITTDKIRQKIERKEVNRMLVQNGNQLHFLYNHES